ncbi:hypothetical protein POJ06DRAFT_124579 [Lipomyces tetrasporus]|uniref:CFEM domain-containing protein n=1 Tax=Lipomyces tetrasporus TaxID=54092 RepID=A0AAD7QRV4_9ASCO|nr:uncharacterized protein POJ06DRAFT_124579 [Lipomyces tetrasporus]KAJ8100111.1 hypothetical protein POJ06DRAFT_124579 [Lipomyces tetrasporus]
MRSIISRVVLVTLIFGVSIIQAVQFSDAPPCYKPCIDNTKIISECDRNDLECLCRDSVYQLGISGCFHSQCASQDLLFAQNLATSDCVRFNIQPGANPHIARRDTLEKYMKRQLSSGMLSGSQSLSLSSTRLSLSSTRLSSFFSSSGSSFGTGAFSTFSASTTSYAPPPIEARHIVKRMQDYGMNECGQSCFYSRLAAVACDPTDLACVCSSAYFNAVTDCLVDSCYDQIPLAFQVRPALCAAP